MKNILIMRHAKSDWSTGAEDFDRPLNKRGKKAAPLMGIELIKRDIVPDIIISSPAKRARQTTKRLIKKCEYKNEVHFDKEFYFGSVSDVFTALKALENQYNRAMVVGHNPIWESLVTKLSIDNPMVIMPTAAIVSLKAPIESWNDLEYGICDFEWIVTPKMLKPN